MTEESDKSAMVMHDADRHIELSPALERELKAIGEAIAQAKAARSAATTRAVEPPSAREWGLDPI